MQKTTIPIKFAVTVVFAFIILAVGVHAAGNIRTVVTSIDPQPVMPGNDLTLKIAYTNFDTTATHLTANLDISYPFSLKSSTENFQNGFDLCGQCARTNTYFITVDPSALSGFYPMYIRMTGVNYQETDTINVSVQGTPNLVLIASPISNVTPSNRFDMALLLENIGTGLAKEVKVVSKSSDFVALGATVQTAETVSPHNSSYIYFSLSPNQDLTAGSYNLPFEIDYKDEEGVSYSLTQNIGVRVVNDGLLGVEDIKVAATAGGTVVAGSPLTAVVRLQNVGHGDVNNIESTITCDGQTNKAFLGQLKKDEDAPAVFEMTMPRGGTYQCSVYTTYTDDLGNHNMTSTFDMTVKNPDFPIILPLIIILTVGFYFYRKRKKK